MKPCLSSLTSRPSYSVLQGEIWMMVVLPIKSLYLRFGMAMLLLLRTTSTGIACEITIIWVIVYRPSSRKLSKSLLASAELCLSMHIPWCIYYASRRGKQTYDPWYRQGPSEGVSQHSGSNPVSPADRKSIHDADYGSG